MILVGVPRDSVIVAFHQLFEPLNRAARRFPCNAGHFAIEPTMSGRIAALAFSPDALPKG
jgi:hypothetical protein